MGRRREHVDRRAITKYYAAFDRTGDRAEIACRLICASCGHLVAPPVADPHRATKALVPPCSHCQSNAWLDLAEDEQAERLCAVEAYEVATVDRGRRARNWIVRIGGAASMMVIWFFTVTNSYSAIFSGLTTLLTVLAVPFFLLGFGHHTRTAARKLPYRWALPLPPTAKPTKRGASIRGPVGAASRARVTAPLSGRTCLGYRVLVRRESAPSNAAPGLLVQRTVDLVVDGTPVHAKRVRLDLDGQAVEVPDGRATQVNAWLREHGIIEAEGPWILEEAILEENTPVVAEAAITGGALLRAA